MKKKKNIDKSNEAARIGKSFYNKSCSKLDEFSYLIEILELSSTATEQEDLENTLFLELNIVK